MKRTPDESNAELAQKNDYNAKRDLSDLSTANSSAPVVPTYSATSYIHVEKLNLFVHRC